MADVKIKVSALALRRIRNVLEEVAKDKQVPSDFPPHVKICAYCYTQGYHTKDCLTYRAQRALQSIAWVKRATSAS